MRVVLDTNILVSAFNFPGGPPEDVYRLAIGDRIEPVTSLPLLTELGRVLHEKFGWAPSRVEDAVSQVAGIATIVRPREHVRVVKDDPSDDHALDAAAAGAAALIVSGDRHLLRLQSWRGIRIVKASTLLFEIQQG